MRKPKNQAEHLIQIWARKKYVDSHQEGDFYTLELENYEASRCPTCGDGAYSALEIFRHRNGRSMYIDCMRNINISSWLQEVTCPFEPLE